MSESPGTPRIRVLKSRRAAGQKTSRKSPLGYIVIPIALGLASLGLAAAAGYSQMGAYAALTISVISGVLAHKAYLRQVGSRPSVRPLVPAPSRRLIRIQAPSQPRSPLVPHRVPSPTQRPSPPSPIRIEAPTRPRSSSAPHRIPRQPISVSPSAVTNESVASSGGVRATTQKRNCGACGKSLRAGEATAVCSANPGHQIHQHCVELMQHRCPRCGNQIV